MTEPATTSTIRDGVLSAFPPHRLPQAIADHRLPAVRRDGTAAGCRTLN
jgi:hypothetical protein